MPDNKRPYAHDGQDYGHRPSKRQHHDDRKPYHNSNCNDRNVYDDRRPYHRDGYSDRGKHRKKQNDSPTASTASKMRSLADLPPLPSVTEEYREAPFTHRSVTSESRSVTGPKALSYERLEFLGDAYIELFASRLIFSRLIHLPSGQMSQLRELFVRNDTLAEYSRAYGFDKRIRVADLNHMQADSRKSNKGFNKVLGDVFEAYVSAVVLSHGEEGFSVAEQWLYALWKPKLREAIQQDKNYDREIALPDDGNGDPRTRYDPEAKATLQRRIIGGADKKLFYEPYKDSIELKGDKLGQNRHFIALYLTGYGYEKKLLGRGEGKNKVEAGNWAAIEAMYGDSKHIVNECENISKTEKERRLAEKKAAEQEANDVGKEDGHVVKVE
ncbi:hypothetical protein M409DRAFT_16632 [Zasmidium cellare ATCC 36951]|uniref:RNase III domain-containing protein n=1 Tax=Zasmidium cellare ATCC 36951 TaxID=1080233 RepID=A0A6A6D2S8_ZASCE|nr:uncharacterized protein M409DRAFT_16632 [Zasmidium cellare ATCC 36951]KAF2172670.1 hypothetical protein M409DRAFT_16632 [Zasmidium cellare ATCC 36951]